MKISKIELVNFRGFPGRAVYDFNFGDANNLFVYGENGSGKSSLFLALQEFFNNERGTKPFSDFKNDADLSITEGRVTVHFDDGTQHAWADGLDRPITVPVVAQIANQIGCFDYRSLLETNFTHRGDEVNLFFIAVNTIVPHKEVPVAGKSVRIVELWNEVVRAKPRYHYQNMLRRSDTAVLRFNEGFEPVITPLIERATALLIEHFDPKLTLSASYQKLRYDQTTRTYKNTELILSVRRSGTELLRHHNILNEARLSAIGLVIYLAGLLISVPTASTAPKVLVLDDVLVGLDMANRVPVLAILASHFSDWQIVLMTHDQVWYEMVMMDPATTKWSAYELWLSGDGKTPTHRHFGCNVDFFLDRAKQHLGNHDNRAAGLYARAGLEWKVKQFCDKRSVKVPYSKDPRKLKIEDAWEAAKDRSLSVTAPPRRPELEALFAAVDTAKKVVLNPLSHSTPQPLAHDEVEEAINAVMALKFVLDQVAVAQIVTPVPTA